MATAEELIRLYNLCSNHSDINTAPILRDLTAVYGLSDIVSAEPVREGINPGT